jgi:uncharacterized metal-binding protein
MVDLPKKKVGIVACSGEEIAEGTVTRLAALRVLEQLRPDETVTICLPLFLAGGEGDRAFARFYPTIAIDGCDKRCAARATEMYSGKPAASIVVSELVSERGMEQPQGRRQLDSAGMRAVEITAERVAEMVDTLIEQRWNRRSGEFEVGAPVITSGEAKEATCSCATAIPVQKIKVDGGDVTLAALPLIFAQLREQGKEATAVTGRELLDMVRVYNPIPEGADASYEAALVREYNVFCQAEKVGP